MRRHSLIGPLLLVLVGVFFLLQNLRPDWVSFAQIATYWPYLLIAWGLLRIMEILYWRFTSRPLPSRGVSGGEWTLIVFLCLIGATVFFVHERSPRLPRVVMGDFGMELFGESYDYPVAEQRQPIKAARVVIQNLRGNVRVVGADAEEIKVGGRKTVRAVRQSEADSANQRTSVEIVTQGEEVIVRTNQDSSARQLGVSTDLEVTVPRGVSIQTRGRNGDLDVVNLAGSVDISSDNAGVRLQDIGGDVRVSLRNSNIVRAINVKGKVEVTGKGRDVELENIGGDVTIDGVYSGDFQFRNLAKPAVFKSGVTDLRIERLPGQFHMDLSSLTSDNLVGPIRIVAKSRDIQLSNFQGPVEVSLDRGDIDLSPRRDPNERIDAKTRSGDVTLTLPPGAKFEVTGATRRGEVTSAFGDSVRVNAQRGGATVNGSTGQGPAITLNTDMGKIDLRKQ
jgi:DUF4097 and DUF4098 domain-containing protein YvlB